MADDTPVHSLTRKHAQRRRRGIRCTIPEKADQVCNRKAKGSRRPPARSLVGRQAELDTLATLVPSARLLTIVGTGGCHD